MNSSITFAQFDAAMEELGFRIEPVKGSHVNYWHDGWDKPYMTQSHKPKDLVPNFVLAGTRIQLQHLGLATGDQFDEMLQSAAA